jgi:predicted metal-dependent hydrolase
MPSSFFTFKIVKRKRRPRRTASTASQTHYKERREAARELVEKKLTHWNRYYNFSYNRVSIRNQRSRWGSCSSKGNLNFNYRILFLEEDLQDYLIVHELCHLQEMNHGPKFWRLVEQTIPNARSLQKKMHMQID